MPEERFQPLQKGKNLECGTEEIERLENKKIKNTICANGKSAQVSLTITQSGNAIIYKVSTIFNLAFKLKLEY
jgi:hypothetical protein